MSIQETRISLPSYLLKDTVEAKQAFDKESVIYQKVIDQCREKLKTPNLDEKTKRTCRQLISRNVKLLRLCQKREETFSPEVLQAAALEKSNKALDSMGRALSEIPNLINELYMYGKVMAEAFAALSSGPSSNASS
jgi:hypothetical protein